MKHELWYSVVVRDRQGKVVSRERRKSRSFLKQWNQLVYVMMEYDSGLTIKDGGGINRAVVKDSDNFTMSAAIGMISKGIVVGTGNTAVDISDFQLEARIVEGVGAGQMEYQACTIDQYIVAAPSCSFAVHRTIANNSGGIITVREAGIYMLMSIGFCCGIRDVFTTPQAVPNGGSITVDWTIKVTV